MPMTATSRNELNKLREVVHFLLTGAGATKRDELTNAPLCYFCRKALDTSPDFKRHGNTVGPKFVAKLSVHHLDEDHENNIDMNKALCHTKCHKSHHRRLSNLTRAAAQKEEE